MEHLLNDGSLAQWKLGLQEGQADIYHINVDSVSKHSGKYSLKISGSNSSGTYCSAYLQLPAIYAGKKITLKGFMKTQGVINGFAGLFMSLETTNYVYFYNNMQDQNIHGDNNWSEYKIEFNYNPEITRINIGGLLVGQGNVWLDDLSISIDDENIQNAARKFISQWYKDTSFEMGSRISIKATPIVNHSLNILGQVWGFLKYHHPLIASGKLNWDAELLKELPRIIPITSNQELMRELEGWIDKYPLYETCDTCLNKIDSSKISVFSDYGDLFKDGFLNDPVRNKLVKLLKNTSFDSSYYIELDKNAGNAKFKNEKSYQNGFPDDGLRLLGLFRYWASIQYFYPFRNNLKGKWNEILLAFIPDMLNARDSLKY